MLVHVGLCTYAGKLWLASEGTVGGKIPINTSSRAIHLPPGTVGSLYNIPECCHRLPGGMPIYINLKTC